MEATLCGEVEQYMINEEEIIQTKQNCIDLLTEIFIIIKHVIEHLEPVWKQLQQILHLL